MNNVAGPCFLFTISTPPSPKALAAFRRWLAEHHPEVFYIRGDERQTGCHAWVEGPPEWGQSSMARCRDEVWDAYEQCNDAHPSPAWLARRRREADREAAKEALRRAEEQARLLAETKARRESEERQREYLARPEVQERWRRLREGLASLRADRPDVVRLVSEHELDRLCEMAAWAAPQETDGMADYVYARLQNDLDLARRGRMAELLLAVFAPFAPDPERFAADVRNRLADLDARRARKAARP